MDGRLKKMFGLHSGVRLYITRVGQRRYQLSALRKPHTVPKCKFFVSNGTGGWHVEFRDELVEWETGDDVFRHQITFEEMEALHAEASSLSALTIAERREDEARGENRARSAVDANISRSPSAESDIPSG
jgi:hypothetical protein